MHEEEKLRDRPDPDRDPELHERAALDRRRPGRAEPRELEQRIARQGWAGFGERSPASSRASASTDGTARTVDARGAGADLSAQAGGAEGERRGEAGSVAGS